MANAVTRDLTKGNPTKLLICFALPMVAGSIFQQLYNIVDTMVVGRYVSADALAAVGTTGNITSLVLMLVFGATTGMSVVVSQFYGSGNMEKLKKAVSTSLVLIVALAIIFTIAGIALTEPLLRLINVPEGIMAEAASYMRIILAGTIATAMYNMSSSMLRALGNSVMPLVFLILSSFLNVGLDLLFVLSFGWGVAGVAWATVIATAISAILCTVYAWVRTPVLQFGPADLKPDKEIALMVAKVGLPSSIQFSTISLGMVLIQSLVNGYGATVMAAYTVALKLEGLFTFPSSSVGSSMQVYAGQNVGAGDYGRVKQGFRAAMKIILIYNVAAITSLVFLGQWMLGLFTTDGAEVVRIGYQYVLITCWAHPLVGLLILTRSTLHGAGDALVPMVMSLIELGSRFLCSFFLSIPFGYLGVFFGTTLAWILGCAYGMVRYYSGKWLTKSLVSKAPAEALTTDDG